MLNSNINATLCSIKTKTIKIKMGVDTIPIKLVESVDAVNLKVGVPNG